MYVQTHMFRYTYVDILMIVHDKEKKNCVGLDNIVRIEIDGRVNFKVRAAAAISKFSIFHLL